MTLEARFETSPEVVTRDMGGEIMLLDLASGTYFGLNPVGAIVWQMLDDGQTLATACDRVAEEFDIDRETLETDVLALTKDLVAKGLATPA